MYPRLAHLVLCSLFLPLSYAAAGPVVRFAWLSDVHVGSPGAEADLRAAVSEINSRPGIDFVIVSGDVTEYGSGTHLLLARAILDSLRVPCWTLPGNHDTRWSESGGTAFLRIWGNDRFAFDRGDVRFIGMHQGPRMRMADGHWAPEDVRWLDSVLAATDTSRRIVFVTHYPVDSSIANWFVVLDRLKAARTGLILVGHGHAQQPMEFEGIPAFMCRSVLRGSDLSGGYSIVTLDGDSARVESVRIGAGVVGSGHGVRMRGAGYEVPPLPVNRPQIDTVDATGEVRLRWSTELGFTVSGSPATDGTHLYLGDASGSVHALRGADGRRLWSYRTSGPIHSTPAVAHGRVVIASTDSCIYSLNASDGSLAWRFRTAAPVVASPAISGGTVFVGAGDGRFRAIDLATGELCWEYAPVEGHVEARPAVGGGIVVFGAWDEKLYACDALTGRLLWHWRGERRGVLYSPAACWPVILREKVFIVAPDRMMTCLDLRTGRVVWRSGMLRVRETLGAAGDGSRVFVRTMVDTLAAIDPAADTLRTAWVTNAGFGYDINSAMIAEAGGILYFGTKGGMLYAVDAALGQVRWRMRGAIGALSTPLLLSTGIAYSDPDGVVRFLEYSGR